MLEALRPTIALADLGPLSPAERRHRAFVIQPIDLVNRMPNPANRGCFSQKWLVHRPVRPKAFGGRIHNHVTGAAKYPIHSDVLNSAALKVVWNTEGSYLLSQAHPVGSPLHPSIRQRMR